MANATRRDGDSYRVLPEEVERFRRDGYVHLGGVVSEEELCELERVYCRFLAREIDVVGRDFCDMTGDYARPVEDYSIVNIMLPRRYHAPLAGNPYERRAAAIARALCGEGMELDYDQLVAKPPRKPDAVFHWHQDLAYWIDTPDTRTASFWLALDDTSEANGCLCFVPGSHKEPRLRSHRPLFGERGKSHTLVAALEEGVDVVRAAPIRRGDVTVHHERTLHGSHGNLTGGWRRGYVVAFRAREAVAEERRRGFTHSHNDSLAVLDAVGRAGESRAWTPA